MPTTVTWQRGDLLVLYTDGIVEVENDTGEMFGGQRLERVMADSLALTPHEVISRVRGELVEFSGRDQYDDDISLVVVRFG